MPNIMTKERLECGEVICGVCNKPIEVGQEWDFYPISQMGMFANQDIVAHTKCVEKTDMGELVKRFVQHLIEFDDLLAEIDNVARGKGAEFLSLTEKEMIRCGITRERINGAIKGAQWGMGGGLFRPRKEIMGDMGIKDEK